MSFKCDSLVMFLTINRIKINNSIDGHFMMGLWNFYQMQQFSEEHSRNTSDFIRQQDTQLSNCLYYLSVIAPEVPFKRLTLTCAHCVTQLPDNLCFNIVQKKIKIFHVNCSCFIVNIQLFHLEIWILGILFQKLCVLLE